MPHKHSRNFHEFIKFVIDQGFDPKTVIDVGTCYGTPELQEGWPEAYHILFEPVAELEPRLQALTAKYQGEYHMVALGNSVGEMQMSVPEDIASATLAKSDDSGRDTRTVKIDTLDNLLGERALEGPVLLKTDCQGFDLEVIKGGESLLERVELIIMEANLFHPAGNDQLADLTEIVAHLKGLAFSVYDIISYQKRPLDGALGYVDLVFVKSNGRFRTKHQWS